MKDKIIFWIDSPLYFALAKFLQEKHGCQLFAVIDVTDRSKKFFQEQQLVTFQKVWYYFDYILKTNKKPDTPYLQSFERRYNINLWLIAQNERLFKEFNEYYKFKHDEILSILEQECRLFENVLDEIEPDFLIIKTTDFHHNHLFYEICKSRGIKILMLGQSRFGYKCTISEELDKFDFIKDLNNIAGSGRTIEELQNYLRGFDVSKQLANYKNKFLSSNWKRLKAAYQFLIISKNTNYKTHYTYYGRTKFRVLTKEILNFLKKKYRESFINRNLIRVIDNTIPFIYLPLHIEPERSLLIAAPFYTNQIETVKHIAKSLPVGYKLYVKEYPNMGIRDWRPISFYKEIINLPNVQLIHPSVSANEIMNKCSLVISVSGTSALEAAFFKKPSIIFADLGYSILPSVYKLKAIEELPEAIRSSLQKVVDPSDLDKYVNLFEKNSFEFDLVGFQIEYEQYFYYGGFLLDVDIPTSKMQSFLDKHKLKLGQLAIEHIKKIKQHKDITLNKTVKL